MARPATARLFIALDLPSGVREELVAWTRRASAAAGGQRVARGRRREEDGLTFRPSSRSALRLLGAEALHMTVCFLGPRPVHELPTLLELIEQEVEPTISEIAVGAPLWLPPRRPRVLAVEVHDRGGALAALHREVVRGLEWAGVEPADGRRGFHPHITVARMRPGMVPRERLLPPTPRLSFLPERLVLYRSFLRREGARYEEVAARETVPQPTG